MNIIKITAKNEKHKELAELLEKVANQDEALIRELKKAVKKELDQSFVINMNRTIEDKS